jgi:hypothetical protein
MSTKNIARVSVYAYLPARSKYALFICKDTQKNQIVDRNVKWIVTFSPQLCLTWGEIGVHYAFFKCASENSTVNVNLNETMKLDGSLLLYL